MTRAAGQPCDVERSWSCSAQFGFFERPSAVGDLLTEIAHATSSKVRFTIRSLVIAVALTALNLAAVIATPSNVLQSEGLVLIRHGLIHRDERWEYGLSCWYARPITPTDERIGARIWSLWRLPEPRIIEVWSRVIVSSSITLLVLTLRLWDWGMLRRSTLRDNGGASHPRRRRAWLAWRLMMIIMTLTALTLGRHCHSADRVRLSSVDHRYGPGRILVGLGARVCPDCGSGRDGRSSAVL